MKIKKIEMKTWFLILGFSILVIFNYTKFDPTEIILLLSKIFITFPLILLGIFAISKVRLAIKESYYIDRNCILAEIHDLRKKQEKLEDKENIEALVKIDRKILSLRENMRAFKNNRFEKCIFYSIILFIITIILTFFDLGDYLGISNILLIVIIFMAGTYYIFQMIQSIFYCFYLD